MTDKLNGEQTDACKTDTSEPGQLVIVSGPSGAGKSTVLRELMNRCDLPLELSVSVTTRRPRKGEVEGREYHFVSRDEFQTMRDAGEFLECMEVFGRDWYGTRSKLVDAALSRGKWIILEIDVQGAMSVMKCRDCISFFVHPGTREELETRLRRRATEDEVAIQRRLEVADEELAALSYYDHEIINRDVDLAVDEICQLLKKSAGKSNACLKN